MLDWISTMIIDEHCDSSFGYLARCFAPRAGTA
jgi:hypothetical protein